jgi:hypothetical protein
MSVYTHLRKGEISVCIGFRPHDMGVTVQTADGSYHPEWRLNSELVQQTDSPGVPEFWATDGHRINFDKPAAADYLIHCEKTKP